MRVQQVDMHVCSMARPSDVSEFEALLDGGTIRSESVVALVGKTEGTGLHDDSAANSRTSACVRRSDSGSGLDAMRWPAGLASSCPAAAAA